MRCVLNRQFIPYTALNQAYWVRVKPRVVCTHVILHWILFPDPVGKKKPVCESGVSFSEGEVPRLPKQWYGPRSGPGDGTHSNEHGILTPQWNPLSTSEDSTSKVCATWCAYIVHLVCVQHGVHILCTWCVCNMVCVYCALGVCATWCVYIVHLVCVQHGVRILCTWCVCNMVCVYCAFGVCATWCAYIVHLVCVPMYSTYLCQKHQNYGQGALVLWPTYVASGIAAQGVI